jgi:predicted DNA-binding transcriptional regulator AlpA
MSDGKNALGVLTEAELAAALKCSTKTLHRWRKDTDIPHKCVGRKVYYVESEVREWLKGGK